MTKPSEHQEQSAFRYQTHTGANGETLYHAPIEIRCRADLDNYGITWNDCRTIDFGGTDSRTVFFYKTPNRELVKEQWRELRSTHTEKITITRCMIPGTRKPRIRCETKNSCNRCPYNQNTAERQLNIISWERMVEDTGDAAMEGITPGNPTEETAIRRVLIAELKAILDSQDPRLMEALTMKELYGFTVQEIAEQLHCSQPRIYQLLQEAKAIARDYLTNDEETRYDFTKNS